MHMHNLLLLLLFYTKFASHFPVFIGVVPREIFSERYNLNFMYLPDR